MIRVLFICTGNSARSQMAEALLNHLGRGRFEAHSGGLEPGRVNEFAIRAMAELEIDISKAKSKGLDQFFALDNLDFVITLCSDADARCPMFPGNARKEHWPFEDPARFSGTAEETSAKFREVRELIKMKIEKFISQIEENDVPRF